MNPELVALHGAPREQGSRSEIGEWQAQHHGSIPSSMCKSNKAWPQQLYKGQQCNIATTVEAKLKDNTSMKPNMIA